MPRGLLRDADGAAGFLLTQMRGQIPVVGTARKRQQRRLGVAAAVVLIAFLAAASLGATWSSCSPDFGARAVADRFTQISPVVFVAVSGYVYNGRSFDCRPVVEEIRSQIPSLRATVLIDYLSEETTAPDTVPWSKFVRPGAPMEFDPDRRRQTIRELAEMLGVGFAFVAELTEREPLRGRTVAFYGEGGGYEEDALTLRDALQQLFEIQREIATELQSREDTDLVRVAQRVRGAAEEPVSLGEESVMLTLSIGMAQGSTHHIGADELR